MSAPAVIRNIESVLATKTLIPALTRYNRLESRPRTDNFARALRAEVRDALWMLCKQWQLGEFGGEDAGSPVSAKLHVEGQQIAKYQPFGHPTQTFDRKTPLEATVEQRDIPFQAGKVSLGLDLRLQWGRHWLKMIPATARPAFRDFYKITAPDPMSKDDAARCAHPEVFQQFAAVAGRAMDGAALYLHLKEPVANLASDGVAGLSPADKSAADAAGPAFKAWVEKLYLLPAEGEGDAWQPERLEYQFACAVPDGAGGEKVLTADEYYHGHLDWYNFDWDKSQQQLGDTPAPNLPVDELYRTRSFIPAPVRFSGMPDTRWWAFEDGKTNFGDIKPGTTEIAKLLLVEFGLVYANDWFLLPYTVPSGSALNIKGLSVTNTFGERFWIEAAGSGPDEAWQRWAMFSLNIKGQQDEKADLTLLMLPTVPKTQDGAPREVVALTRDEMANMVWGIETVVPTPSGWPRGGSIAAGELHAHLQALLDAGGAPAAAPIEWKAAIRYDVMTTVPEHWIPFVPEHVEGSNRQIQLRRAAMPRFLQNDPAPTFERVRPRTTLLSEGLDRGLPYRIHEEEVPRAGAHVLQAFQRTRWNDGRVFVWLGVRKRTGRGEGHSGLAFDGIPPTGK
ncbi:MAG: hypothetical protein WDO56_05965 [Gammaproteobacteria bacterium]